jgi:hypothetical protein
MRTTVPLRPFPWLLGFGVTGAAANPGAESPARAAESRETKRRRRIEGTLSART